MSSPVLVCKPAAKEEVSAKRRVPGVRAVALFVCWVAVLLRFLFLGHRSLWLDEAVSFSIAHRGWTDFVGVLWHHEANMTLYYLLLRPVLHFGDSEFCLRLIPAIAGVATLPVMFLLGRKIFNTRLGWLATMLLAVNACHIAYSQEARGYSLAVLFCALSSLFFVTAIESPRAGTWLLYAVLSGLGVYCHFYAGLVLVAQWVSLAMLPRHRIPWKCLIPALLLVAAFVTPAAFVALTHDIGQLSWIPPASPLEIYHTAIFLAANGGKLLGNLLLLLSLVALGTAGRSLVRDWKSDEPVRRWRQAFLWSWLLVPVALTLLLSLLGKPVFFHRYLIVCLPAFLLLTAQGLASLRRANVLLTMFVLFSLSVAMIYGTRSREDWRGAVAYVLSHAEPGDAVFLCRDIADAPFRYYEHRLHGGGNIPVCLNTSDIQTRHPARLWAVFYSSSPNDQLVNSTKTQLSERYPVRQEVGFRGVRLLLFDMAPGTEAEFSPGRRHL